MLLVLALHGAGEAKQTVRSLKPWDNFPCISWKMVPSWVDFWLVERNPLCGTGRVGMLEVQPQSQGRFGSCWGGCSAQVLHTPAAAFLTQKHYQEISMAPSALLWIAKTLKRKIYITEWSKTRIFSYAGSQVLHEAGLFLQWLFHGSVGVFQLYLCVSCAEGFDILGYFCHRRSSPDETQREKYQDLLVGDHLLSAIHYV